MRFRRLTRTNLATPDELVTVAADLRALAQQFSTIGRAKGDADGYGRIYLEHVAGRLEKEAGRMLVEERSR